MHIQLTSFVWTIMCTGDNKIKSSHHNRCLLIRASCSIHSFFFLFLCRSFSISVALSMLFRSFFPLHSPYSISRPFISFSLPDEIVFLNIHCIFHVAHAFSFRKRAIKMRTPKINASWNIDKNMARVQSNKHTPTQTHSLNRWEKEPTKWRK